MAFAANNPARSFVAYVMRDMRPCHCDTRDPEKNPSLPSASPMLFRRRSLLGGYKAHSEAVAGAKKHNGPAAEIGKAPAPAAQGEEPDSKGAVSDHVRPLRRLSEAPVQSESCLLYTSPSPRD